MEGRFDEAMVERLACAYYEAKTRAHVRSLGFDEPIKWQDAGQARQLAHQDGVRAVLSSLSQDYAIVPKAECEALTQALRDLLHLYYDRAPNGKHIKETSDDELRRRMEFIGPEIFRVGPILAARTALQKEATPHV